MIRRERVRESCTMTEGLVSGISRGFAPHGTSLPVDEEAGEDPRARSRDTAANADSEHVGFTMSFNISALDQVVISSINSAEIREVF